MPETRRWEKTTQTEPMCDGSRDFWAPRQRQDDKRLTAFVSSFFISFLFFLFFFSNQCVQVSSRPDCFLLWLLTRKAKRLPLLFKNKTQPSGCVTSEAFSLRAPTTTTTVEMPTLQKSKPCVASTTCANTENCIITKPSRGPTNMARHWKSKLKWPL